MLPEIAHDMDRIDDLRRQINDLITQVSVEALNWHPIEGENDHATNSLAVMAAHVAGAEHYWLHEVIGRQPATRQRELEFKTMADDASHLTETLTENAEISRQILIALSADDLAGSRQVPDRTVTVRWAILQVIDHTALHLGHMQITYPLWNGGQAAAAPRWFQRLPGRSPQVHSIA